MKHRDMSYDEWLEEFGPLIPNLLSDHDDCEMYETYGSDLVFVASVHQTGTRKVWTLMSDDNGEDCISEGMAFVNRIAYIITQRPYPADTTFYVKLD